MRIDLWADIACPWCFIGERRLRRALEAEGIGAEVRWRPYQLNPGLPGRGRPWGDFVQEKFGGWDRARPMFAHVAQAGASEGIRFDFDRVASAPNTARAHGLMLQAEREHRLWEAADTIYSAYFTEGRDVGDDGVLRDLARRAGLDPSETERVLGDVSLAAEIGASQVEAARMGVNGVPFFVLDGRFALSGAQPIQTFRDALRRASEPT